MMVMMLFMADHMTMHPCSGLVLNHNAVMVKERNDTKILATSSQAQAQGIEGEPE